MADSASNFYIKQDFNANYDITWSFQYAITGSTNSTGGFSTFLFNNSILTGGGSYTGLGYSPYEDLTGVEDAILGVCFFSDNTIKILKNNTFSVLTSFSIFPSLSPIVKSTKVFNTIRFNLTNLGQTLKISVKNPETDNFYVITEINANLNVKNNDYYKIGFSYASPLSVGDDKINFFLKNIQYQGINKPIDTELSIRPVTVPKAETFYVLQSPNSGYIPIGIPDPISTGFILHKS
jgi:hypothetical protein